MQLQDAVKERRSIRGYLDKPVPKEVLNRIFEIAVRAPSTKNAQPWHFYVASGQSLEQLRKANVERFLSSQAPPAEMEHVMVEPEKGTVYRDRQVDIGKRLFKVLEIAREDKEKRAEWVKRGFRYFDAPAAIILVADKNRTKESSYFDAGLVVQNICLAAVDFGLGTCIENQGITYSDVIRDILGIADEKCLVAALAIGYPDDTYPANAVISPREKVENTVTWCE